MKGKLLQSIDTFTILQGVIAIIILGVWAYLVIMGKSVDKDLYALVGLVVGFFFGGISANVNKSIKEAVNSRKEGV